LYEKVIANYYQQNLKSIFNLNWDELSTKQKEFFLFLGLDLELLKKIQKLDIDTINYLVNFVAKYGDEKIVQNYFISILNFLPNPESRNANIFLKAWYAISNNENLIFLKILEKFFVNFELLEKHHPTILEHLYQSSSNEIKNKIEHFLFFLLIQTMKITNERFKQKILKIFSAKLKLNSSLLRAIYLGYIPENELSLQQNENLDLIILMRHQIHDRNHTLATPFKKLTHINQNFNYSRESALTFSVTHRLFKTLIFLLEEIDNLEFKIQYLKLVLEQASESNNIDLAKIILKKLNEILIDHEESLKNPYKLKLLVLMFSAKLGDMETLESLLVKGLNVNEKMHRLYSFDGSTALMVASMYGQTETAMMLLSRGADLEAKKDDIISENVDTALSIAIKNKKFDTALALLKKGAEISQDLLYIYASNHTNQKNHQNLYSLKQILLAEIKYRALFLKHFDNLKKVPTETFQNILFINYQDKNGDTALHKAIKTKNISAVNAILSNKNVDANIKNKKGETALNLVISVGLEDGDMLDIIEALLIKKANPNLVNSTDAVLDILLRIGAYKNYKRACTIIKLAIANGAKITSHNQSKSKSIYQASSFELLNNWHNSPEKKELLELFIKKILQDGNLSEYLKQRMFQIRHDLQIELTKILTFLMGYDLISEITKSLIEKLNFFMTNNKNIYSDIDVNKLNQLRTMGI
jgi:ankyrin repeat protein